MAERSKRQVEIVQAMMENALVSARAFERDCAAFAETQKLDEMAHVIEELSEWIEERDADRLEGVGISMEDDLEDRLLFRLEGREDPFVVHSRGDMTIVVDGRIVQLDPDLPVLDEDVYAEVLDRLLVWAGASESRGPKRFGPH